MFFCGSSDVIRYGHRGRKQLYKCKSCCRQFIGGNRRDQSQVITDYVDGKQTLSQLAAKYGVSEKTIRRDLSRMRYVHKISKDKDVTVQMDTTYWGRNFGLMVIKDAVRGRILWHKYVHHETIAQYVEGVEWLRGNGFRIYGAVIDGMRGLSLAMRPIRVQMCQFHQMLIVRRYLTQEPDLEASAELLELVNNMTGMDKESFIGAFGEWYEKYREVINERVRDKRIRRRTPPYMRPRLRSAYLSVKRTCPCYGHSTIILRRDFLTQTTHWRGKFSDLKSKVRVHSGISKENRKKLLDEYIKRHY